MSADRARGELTRAELDVLAEVAEAAVRLAVVEGQACESSPDAYPEALRRPGAAFVTLRRWGTLRGCIGTLEESRPLVTTVADRARAAALADPRFPPVGSSELAGLDVSVSVLSRTEPFPVGSWQELHDSLRPGIDGLVVEAGHHRATFLPAVWEEVPGRAAFLDALWRKAGLASRAWPHGIAVLRYTAQHSG